MPLNFFREILCFIPEAWLFTTVSPMFGSANIFIHNLHLFFVLPEWSDNNLSLYSSLVIQYVLNLDILEAILLISHWWDFTN